MYTVKAPLGMHARHAGPLVQEAKKYASTVTLSLDERTADVVLAEFLRLVRGEGSAALVATHNERLAEKMDRVVRLHEGRLEEASAR